MIFKADVLFSGLCVFLAIMIVVVIVSLIQSEKKEAGFKEPVTIALVEDPRTFDQKEEQEQKPVPIHVVAKKQTVDIVSIPTDHSIDTAIQVVTQTANANYENFVNTLPPTTGAAPSVPAAPKPAASLPAAPKPAATPVPSVGKALEDLNKKIKLDKGRSFVDPNASGPAMNKDHADDDIKCYKDGSGPDFCASKCHADQNCRGYNYVEPIGNADWANGGCCYKKKATPLGAKSFTNFYTVNPSNKNGATAAQIGAQADILSSNTKSASAKAAILAAMAAKTPAEQAAALAKAESAYQAVQKTISGYRGHRDSTASKYTNQVFNDPAATPIFTYATGKDTDKNGPELCSQKCNMDPSCRGFQYRSKQDDTSPSGENFAGTGGCQYFKHSKIGTYTPDLKSPVQDIMRKQDGTGDAYVIIPNEKGTIAQKGFYNANKDVQNTINSYKTYNSFQHKNYTKKANQDHAGDDIGSPIVGGSPDACRVKCDSDTSCLGFNYVHNNVKGVPTGKCSYKSKALPLSNASDVDFFTKIPLPAPKPVAPAVAPKPVVTAVATKPATPAGAPKPASPVAAPASTASVASNAGTVPKK